jgi:5-oxoprolinase (ATP-hydrolysing) subunit C
MSEIVVERTGPHALVADGGRFGYLAIGVPWSGAADLLALTVANVMCGNALKTSAIELTFGGAALTFTGRTRFAIAGAECSATLNGSHVAAWGSYEAEPGSTLRFRAPQRGVYTIVAVRGGIDVPERMGSCMSEHPLEKGVRLSIGSAEEAARTQAFRVKPPDWERNAGGIEEMRVIAGGEYESFEPTARERFWTASWTVSPHSSRIASLFDGDPLPVQRLSEMRSHAVLPGVIQVPPSGLPIVLQCDAQTTGGYPKIGVVAEADLWKLAQCEPGTRVRFVSATVDEAAAATRSVERYVEAIERGIHLQRWRPS